MLFCVAGLQCDTGKAAQYEGAEVRMQIAPSMVSIGILFFFFLKTVLNRLLHFVTFCYIQGGLLWPIAGQRASPLRVSVQLHSTSAHNWALHNRIIS